MALVEVRSEREQEERSSPGLVDIGVLAGLGCERMSFMPKTRQRYPPEFRREAVAMVRSGRPLPEVAEALGVSQ